MHFIAPIHLEHQYGKEVALRDSIHRTESHPGQRKLRIMNNIRRLCTSGQGAGDLAKVGVSADLIKHPSGRLKEGTVVAEIHFAPK